MDVSVRPTTDEDHEAIRALYALAFPEEDLWPLVSALLASDDEVLSLAAVWDSDRLGHIIYTPCRTEAGEHCGALLGPLAVAPKHQRSGVGSSLVGHAHRYLNHTGTAQVFVLGDPGYYCRFGFCEERRIKPPYPLPDGWIPAWQSVTLPRRAALPSGTLALPEPWMDPALWTP